MPTVRARGGSGSLEMAERRPGLTVAVTVAVALCVLPSTAAGAHQTATSSVASSPQAGLLFGQLDGLSRRNQDRLREELERATRALGSPVAIEFVLHLPGARAPRDSAARDAFDAHGFDTGRSDPVLLLISPRERRAAIETGKGPAGIVPEIDARGITADLTRDLIDANLPEHLWRALDAIVASARATHERREPMAPDEAPTPGVGTGARPDAPGLPPGEEVGLGEATTPTGPGGDARPRSRLPIAAGIGGLVLLALALQRRRHLSSARAAAEDERAARAHFALARRSQPRPGSGPPTRPNPPRT